MRKLSVTVEEMSSLTRCVGAQVTWGERFRESSGAP